MDNGNLRASMILEVLSEQLHEYVWLIIDVYVAMRKSRQRKPPCVV